MTYTTLSDDGRILLDTKGQIYDNIILFKKSLMTHQLNLTFYKTAMRQYISYVSDFKLQRPC